MLIDKDPVNDAQVTLACNGFAPAPGTPQVYSSLKNDTSIGSAAKGSAGRQTVPAYSIVVVQLHLARRQLKGLDLPSTPERGNTISNPVIPGFHPDPSICRAGEDYYLACSSFEYYPGVPVFHSRDLVHWTQIGNALDRPSQLRLPSDASSSGGLYAPTLRHHDGRFWLIITNVSGDGNLLFTATDPVGPWSDPIRLPGVHGIDPDLAWDDEGNCWCTVAGVSQVRLDPHTRETFEGLFTPGAWAWLSQPEYPSCLMNTRTISSPVVP